jgi:hypothetical protein
MPSELAHFLSWSDVALHVRCRSSSARWWASVTPPISSVLNFASGPAELCLLNWPHHTVHQDGPVSGPLTTQTLVITATPRASLRLVSISKVPVEAEDGVEDFCGRRTTSHSSLAPLAGRRCLNREAVELNIFWGLLRLRSRRAGYMQRLGGCLQFACEMGDWSGCASDVAGGEQVEHGASENGKDLGALGCCLLGVARFGRLELGQ